MKMTIKDKITGEVECGSIGIRKWAAGQALSHLWERGDGDSKLVGWERADGVRAIETNGDPVWEREEGFDEEWSRNAK